MSSIIRNAAMALFLIFITTTGYAQEPSGGPLSRLVCRIRQHHASAATSTTATAVPAPAVQPATICDCSGADPYGFASIFNRLRASAGLQPVAYDPELSSWASQNNSAQCHRGLGHHVNPSCFQNCGWNYTDANAVAQGWMNSPGHRRNLLSPSISRFGIAFGPGPYWTLNAR